MWPGRPCTVARENWQSTRPGSHAIHRQMRLTAEIYTVNNGPSGKEFQKFTTYRRAAENACQNLGTPKRGK